MILNTMLGPSAKRQVNYVEIGGLSWILTGGSYINGVCLSYFFVLVREQSLMTDDA